MVYDMQRHQLHHLNPVASVVWHRCDGQQTIFDLARRCSLAMNTTIAEAQIVDALNLLQEANLLQQPLPTAMATPRSSRRTMVRRMAIGTAVMAPAIVSVSAPALAQASPCRQPEQSCSAHADCCSNYCPGEHCQAVSFDPTFNFYFRDSGSDTYDHCSLGIEVLGYLPETSYLVEIFFSYNFESYTVTTTSSGSIWINAWTGVRNVDTIRIVVGGVSSSTYTYTCTNAFSG